MTAPVVHLVDAGGGRSSGGMGPIDVEQCGRGPCRATARPGFSFCSACLAWLRGDTDEDPLT